MTGLHKDRRGNLSLYVAFSRARAMAVVKVKVLERNQQGIRGGNTVTPNIIINYQDVL